MEIRLLDRTPVKDDLSVTRFVAPQDFLMVLKCRKKKLYKRVSVSIIGSSLSQSQCRELLSDFMYLIIFPLLSFNFYGNSREQSLQSHLGTSLESRVHFQHPPTF